MNDTLITFLITSLGVPLVDNTFHLQLHQIHSIPMINTLLHKTLTMQIKSPYLAITDDKQYCTGLVDMDIMKCLISKGTIGLSGGFYPVHRHTHCALSLCFNNDYAIKSYCSITVNAITKNSVTQLLIISI